MRIKVNINEPNEGQNAAALQAWMEGHSDGQRGSFKAVCANKECLTFEFSYDWMLGCHRLFILDPTDGELLSFFAEDFTDAGKWIFEGCDEYFGCDYEIQM